MIQQIKNRDIIIKTCFAFFPKRIDNYKVWLSRYYKTWDYIYAGIYSGYTPHLFVFEEDAIKYIKNHQLLVEGCNG